MSKVRCTTCNEDVDEQTEAVVVKTGPTGIKYFKCKRCKHDEYELTKCLKTLPEAVVATWREQGKTQKAEFRQEMANAGWENMKHKLLQIHAEKTNTYSRASTMKSSARYLDSPDLKEKYKDKPDQLESVKANAETFWHPVRKVKLYNDVEFSADHTEELKEQTAQRVSSEDVEKGAKRPKPSVQERSAGSTDKGLTPAQKDRITKLREKIVEKNTKLIELQEEAKQEKIAEFIPARCLSKVEETSKKTNCIVAEIGLALCDGWIGQPQDLMKMMMDAKKSLDETHSMCKTYVDQAKLEAARTNA